MTLRLSAVVLAGGEGLRMEGVAKPLLALDGVTLLERTLAALVEMDVHDVVVVTGRHHQRMIDLLRTTDVRVIYNQDHASGLQASVRLGLESAAWDVDAILMVLCDQPFLCARDMRELVTAFERMPMGDILVPEVSGQPGNPVVLSKTAAEQIKLMPRHMACRDFMRLHPERVWRHPTDNWHFTFDLDTFADIRAFESMTGSTVGFPPTDESKLHHRQAITG